MRQNKGEPNAPVNINQQREEGNNNDGGKCANSMSTSGYLNRGDQACSSNRSNSSVLVKTTRKKYSRVDAKLVAPSSSGTELVPRRSQRLLNKRKGCEFLPEKTSKRLKSCSEEDDDSGREERTPFEMLPEEMWAHIFGFLVDARDMQSVINGNMQWRNMYLGQRTTILFQQVVSILADNPTPGYLRYLWQKEYLNSRLVCKSWDRSVQNYIQQHPFNFKIFHKKHEQDDYEYHLYIHQRWQEDRCDWSNFLGLKDFLEEANSSHPPSRNPFLSRRIEITDSCLNSPVFMRPSDEELREYWEEWRGAMDSLLHKYGTHLWHCEIDISLGLSSLTWYTQVQNWISLMPQLKTLCLCYRSSEIGENQGQDLEALIEMHPMPTLGNVKVLQTYDVPAPVFNELIGKVGDLEGLNITRQHSPDPLRSFNLELIPGEALKELHISVRSLEDYHHFETCKNWPLRTLDLHNHADFNCDKSKNSDWPAWDFILTLVEAKFGSTLNKLTIAFPKATKSKNKKSILEISHTHRPNLPQLKELQMSIPNVASFDFLLPLRSTLEKLHLQIEHCKKGHQLLQRDVLKVHGMYHDLFQSNIWQEFPKLEIVEANIADKQNGRSEIRSYRVHTYYRENLPTSAIAHGKI